MKWWKQDKLECVLSEFELFFFSFYCMYFCFIVVEYIWIYIYNDRTMKSHNVDEFNTIQTKEMKQKYIDVSWEKNKPHVIDRYIAKVCVIFMRNWSQYIYSGWVFILHTFWR